MEEKPGCSVQPGFGARGAQAVPTPFWFYRRSWLLSSALERAGRRSSRITHGSIMHESIGDELIVVGNCPFENGGRSRQPLSPVLLAVPVDRV